MRERRGDAWARPLLVATAAWMIGLIGAVAGLGSGGGVAGTHPDRVGGVGGAGGDRQLQSDWSGTSTVEAVTSNTAVGHASDRRAVASGDSVAVAALVRGGEATPAWRFPRRAAPDAVAGPAVDLPDSRAPPATAG